MAMATTMTALAVAAGVGLTAFKPSVLPIEFPRAHDAAIHPADKVSPMEVGMNLGLLAYWSQEFRFVDFIKSSQLMIASPQGKMENWTDQVKRDATGHPVEVPSGTVMVVYIKGGKEDRLPSGTYNCRISPNWSVKPSRVATMSKIRATSFDLNVVPSPAEGSLSLRLIALKDNAELKTLSCRESGAAPDAIFRKPFLDDNRPFGVIRFLDWMKANNQPPQTWATRTTPDHLTQDSPNGVAVEYMVALANDLRSDPWFTLPLNADDDYYRQFATYVRDHLAPDRRAYVEVSNEVWNRGFGQSRQAAAEGAARYPQATGNDPTDLYYADRVRAVMTIWREVFAAQPKRLVRVLAMQAGSEKRAETALAHQDTYKFVDSLAIAPYFGPPPGQPPAGVTDISGYILDHGREYIDKAVQNGRESKSAADRYHLQFMTYEGGPAYVSFRPRFVDAFLAAERDPRMYDLYTEFLQKWRDQVGGLYVAYNSVGSRFGHLTYTGQPLADAPKMRALLDFMERHRLNRAESIEAASSVARK